MKILKQPLWRWGLALMALFILVYLLWGRSQPQSNGITFEARRGPMQISVLEGGSVEALESQEIRSQVKGYQGTKILSIVEEGYLVTDDDIKNGKVLVELDSSDLKQRITTEETQFQSTFATLIEARQAYDIQLNQNSSDIKAAEQKARFALMDLEKYMGSKATREIVAKAGLREVPVIMTIESIEAEVEAAMAGAPMVTSQSFPNPAGGEPLVRRASVSNERVPPTAMPDVSSSAATNPSPPAAPAAEARGEEAPPVSGHQNYSIDFSEYASTNKLGDGSAKQSLRKLEDDLLIAQLELGQARTHLEGTERLRAKDFVTQNELDNEKISMQKSELKVKTAQTALDLFRQYEFIKTAEETLSKYDEALRSLERGRKEAISKLAQAQARMKSAEGRYRIAVEQLRELREQMSNCVIRAKRPGLVVYGGGDERRFFGNEEQIREGATVRERQSIITIPDMTKMAVKVKIHESHINKVKRGQKAILKVDAFPDENLTGEVTKVGVLPDSQNRWMNPDMKVYVTTIAVDGVREWLKPGMSARVEILVNTLSNVVYVPIQAVSALGGKQVCYVARGHGSEMRPVEIGEFNDEFIEIKSGLKEGEMVLLRAPVASPGKSEPSENEEESEEAASGGKRPESRSGNPPAGAAPNRPPSSGAPR